MADAGTRPRIAGLDALRGAALCGMAAYHLVWDLHAFGWPAPDPGTSPGWSAFGDAVAGTFLLLSGVGLVLARPRGPRFALRRLGILAAAALAVTGTSLWFAPEAPILFGILHCMAVANALTLAALRLAPPWRVALAAACAIAPRLFHGPAFDTWPGAALGFAATPPATLDYRPLLPWLAAVLLGSVLGDMLTHPRPERPAPSTHRLGVLRWMGRHSLVLYLLHQPVLYGTLTAIGRPAADEDPFGRQCRADCTATGASDRLCAAACACTAGRLAAEANAGATRITPRHLDEVGAACRSLQSSALTGFGGDQSFGACSSSCFIKARKRSGIGWFTTSS